MSTFIVVDSSPIDLSICFFSKKQYVNLDQVLDELGRKMD